MVACTGCSKFFPNLPDESRCGHCARRDVPPEETWPMCASCGKVFPFLQGECSACSGNQAKSQISQGLEFAMTHSVNPRTHGVPGRSMNANPYATHQPGIAGEPEDENDAERQIKAALIAASMSNGYANAQAFSKSRGGGVKVSRPNMRTNMMPPPLPGLKPVAEITIKIVKVFDVNSPKVKINHMAETWGLPISKLWCDILLIIHGYIDSLWSDKKAERVYSNMELDIIYTLSNSQVPPTYLETTLGDLWASTIRYPQVYIKDSDVKRRILELNVAVNCKATQVREDLEEQSMLLSSQVYPSKRKASVSDPRALGSSSKRPASAVERTNRSISTYSTNIQMTIRLEQYTAEKYTCSFIESKGILWTLMPGNVTFQIEKEPFASGKTKNAFKLHIGSQRFAAKVFYNIGHADDDVSICENTKCLKDELVIQALAAKLLEKFQDTAKSRNISVFNMKVAEAFLLTATTTQQSWLVDPLIPNSSVQKYSGTDKAGHHSESDLVGKSCDAFAHFTLHETAGNLVLVDIQGLMTKTASRGNQLVLLDLMAHSIARDKGLGDSGTDGIVQFSEQHICNDICTALMLDDVSTLAEGSIYQETSDKNKEPSEGDQENETPESDTSNSNSVSNAE